MKYWALTSVSKIYPIRGNPQKVSLGMTYLSYIFLSMTNELLVPKNLLSQTEVDYCICFQKSHEMGDINIYAIFLE